jgi:hypothetical protein
LKAGNREDAWSDPANTTKMANITAPATMAFGKYRIRNMNNLPW